MMGSIWNHLESWGNKICHNYRHATLTVLFLYGFIKHIGHSGWLVMQRFYSSYKNISNFVLGWLRSIHHQFSKVYSLSKHWFSVLHEFCLSNFSVFFSLFPGWHNLKSTEHYANPAYLFSYPYVLTFHHQMMFSYFLSNDIKYFWNFKISRYFKKSWDEKHELLHFWRFQERQDFYLDISRCMI